MDVFKAVQEFHDKFEVSDDIGRDPHLLESDVSDYRIGFLQEELDEYIIATESHDAEECLDALVDLVYVALGTCDLHGYDFNEAFSRVHDANMSKVRVESVKESFATTGRGHILDVVKPDGFLSPDLSDLVIG
jgi:predicted HAD superfamily Cof-like phosphohydrolase